MSSSSSAPTFHFLCLFLRSTGIRSQLQAHSGNGQSESDGVECLIKNQHARIGYLMHMTYGTLPVEALKSHISSRVIRTYYDHEHSCLNLISSLWTPTKMMDLLLNRHLFVHWKISMHAFNIFLEDYFARLALFLD